MDCSLTGSSVHAFPWQEYWSELPFPSPGDLPNPGIEPVSPVLQADSLPGKPLFKKGNDVPSHPAFNKPQDLREQNGDQWLIFHDPNAGDHVRSLVRELDPTHHS